MDISVVGVGYVGLVTGTCFAEMGHNVTCVDVDIDRIQNLKKGIIPIYEPGLQSMVVSNVQQGRLKFTTSLAGAMETSDVHFIAVGTPPGEDGSADMQYVLEVAGEIGRNMDRYSVVVNKSTVPVGTAERVRNVICDELKKRGADVEFDVVSNPEFLKEGSAVDDFMKPDRVVVGIDSERAQEIMHQLYAEFTRKSDRVLFLGIKEAEMTKYAANCMLATKISFMNEISVLCDHFGVDVEQVRTGIGSDSRIGYSFIYPGCGYGGSCFPKDVKALVHMAKECRIEPLVLNAVEERNALQKQVLHEKIVSRFGEDLSGLTFGVWGLAFKPGTDDMREATSTVLLKQLQASGARVKAYDPEAMDSARNELPGQWFENDFLILTEHQYSALEGVDAMVLVTEWKPFRHPDFKAMKKMMKQAVIFDGRNQYDPSLLKRDGFEYFGIGRS